MTAFHTMQEEEIKILTHLSLITDSWLWALIFFFFFSFIFLSWRLITLQYCSDFCHTLTWISHGFTCVPHPDPPVLPPSPSHPSRSSQCTSPEHLSLASNVGWRSVSPLIVCILVSMLFAQNIPSSPSPTESESLFCTSVSLFLFCILGYGYHLFKFHIYALVYCIGIVLVSILYTIYCIG